MPWKTWQSLQPLALVPGPAPFRATLDYIFTTSPIEAHHGISHFLYFFQPSDAHVCGVALAIVAPCRWCKSLPRPKCRSGLPFFLRLSRLVVNGIRVYLVRVGPAIYFGTLSARVGKCEPPKRRAISSHYKAVCRAASR